MGSVIVIDLKTCGIFGACGHLPPYTLDNHFGTQAFLAAFYQLKTECFKQFVHTRVLCMKLHKLLVYAVYIAEQTWLKAYGCSTTGVLHNLVK